MSDIFDGIENVPDELKDPSTALVLAKGIATEAGQKAESTDLILSQHESALQATLEKADQQVKALQNGQDFDLWRVVYGRYPKKVEYARNEVKLRSSGKQNLDTIAAFGTPSEVVVNMLIDSSETKLTGATRLEIAGVLDVLSGVSNDIVADKDIQGAEVEKKAKEMIDALQKKKFLLDLLFKRLFNKTLNRVTDYRKRLKSNAGDLAEKSVQIDRISASLQARQELLRDELLETCINGLALKNLWLDAQGDLTKSEKLLAKETDPAARSSLNEQIKEQRGLIQIMVKRLFDLMSSVLEEINMDSLTGTTRVGFAIIKADVEYSRTKVIGNLGYMLGLVVEIITGLRYAQSAKDVRNAKNEATKKLSGASGILQQVTNDILLDVESGLEALSIMTEATVNSIQNNRENMARVLEMHKKSNRRFTELLSKIGNA